MTPYDKYKSKEEWRIINKAVQELIDNGDIIGYFVKQLAENGNTSQKHEQSN